MHRPRVILLVVFALATAMIAGSTSVTTDLAPVFPDRVGPIRIGAFTYDEVVQLLGRPDERERGSNYILAEWKEHGIRAQFSRDKPRDVGRVELSAPFAVASTEGIVPGMEAARAYDAMSSRYGTPAEAGFEYDLDLERSGLWTWAFADDSTAPTVSIRHRDGTVRRIVLRAAFPYTDERRQAFLESVRRRLEAATARFPTLPGSLWHGSLNGHVWFGEDGRYTRLQGDLDGPFGPAIGETGTWTTRHDAVFLTRADGRGERVGRFASDDAIAGTQLLDENARDWEIERADTAPSPRLLAFVEAGGRPEGADWPLTPREFVARFVPGTTTLDEFAASGLLERSAMDLGTGLLRLEGKAGGDVSVTLGKVVVTYEDLRADRDEPRFEFRSEFLVGQEDRMVFRRRVPNPRTQEAALTVFGRGAYTVYEVGDWSNDETRAATTRVHCELRFEGGLLAENSCSGPIPGDPVPPSP